MKTGGIAYISFKYGDFEGYRNGRYFTDMNEERLENLLKDRAELELIETAVTGDVRPGRESEKWLNVLLKKVSSRTSAER